MSVRRESLLDGAVVRLVLDNGKGNIVDRVCVAALSEEHARAQATPNVRAVILDHEGPHFSFGASVQEHLPGQVESMLPELHRLVVQFARSEVPLIACVKGSCLGGGLEVAMACTRILAAPDAKLGQPEVQLGVFAPAASVLLPLRVGEGHAASLLLSGQAVPAMHALAIGLVDEVTASPLESALSFCQTELVPKSAAAVRFAHRALRLHTVDALERLLPQVERLYLSDLMRTHDANEGLRAFVDKRAPRWTHG